MWQVPTAVGNDYWREDNAGGWLPVARFNGSQALGQTRHAICLTHPTCVSNHCLSDIPCLFP